MTLKLETKLRWGCEDVKELVETIISDSWSFPALRP